MTPVPAVGAGDSNVHAGDPFGTVSNLSMKNLLYPGFTGTITTEIVCHYQPWFGQSNHINISKSLNSAAEVKAEADAMITRGCTIIAPDWYGGCSATVSTNCPSGVLGESPTNGGLGNKTEDQVTILWRNELDSRCSGGSCPLKLAITIDGKNPTLSLGMYEDAFIYLRDQYFGHASYWKVTDHSSCANRPVVLYFNDVLSTTDWGNLRTFVQSSVGTCTGEPAFTFQNSGGFSHTQSDGAFEWISVDAYDDANPTTDPGSMQFNQHFANIDSFSTTAASTTNFGVKAVEIGAAYKGFNDTNACWGFAPGACDPSNSHPQGRKMDQECGMTWLNSFTHFTGTGKFSSSKQIQALGIPTWNDWEEGSEIETGIDNCINDSSFVLSGPDASQNINWTLQFSNLPKGNFGNPITIDHFVLWDNFNGVFSPRDPIISRANCTFSSPTLTCPPANLSNYRWTAGTHTLSIQAIGAPAIKNHLSSSITFTATPVAGVAPGSLDFGSVNPGTTSPPQSVIVSDTGNADLSFTSVSITGNYQIQSNTCTGALPAGQSCTINVVFTPTTATNPQTGTLTISDNAGTGTQTVSLTGNGGACPTCPPSLQFSPSPLDFGSVTTSKTSPVTVTNIGPTALNVTSITATAEYSVAGNTCGSSIAANGGSCTVNVTFTPTGQGARPGTLTVSGLQSGTTTPTLNFPLSLTGTNGNVQYPNLDQASWTGCSGACTGTATATFSLSQGANGGINQDGASAQFTIGGATPYSDVMWQSSLTNNSTYAHYVLMASVFMTDPTIPQGFYFGISQAANGKNYPFRFLCDLRNGGVWKVYDPTTPAWVNTGQPCKPTTFAANGWTSLSFAFERTSSNQLHYQSITVNGVTTSLSNVAMFNPTSLTPDSITAFFGLFGNASQNTYSIFVDNWALSATTTTLQSGPAPVFTPASLDFSLNTVGSNTSQTITLANNGDTAINSATIATTGDYSQTNNCPTSIGAGANCTITVTFTPSTHGTRSGTLTLNGTNASTGTAVSASTTLTGVGSGTVTYSHIDQLTGWTSCTGSCVGTGNATSSLTQGIVNPSRDGASAQFTIGGTTPYSDVQWTNQTLANNSSISHFTLDTYVFMTDPSVPQGFYFDAHQVVGGNSYAFRFLCDLRNGAVWKVWTGSTGSWSSIGVPCSASSLPPNSWIHMSFDFERTSGNQLHYQSITVNGVTTTLNNVLFSPTSNTNSQVYVQFGEFGNSTQSTYSIWVDTWTLTGW